MALNVKPQYGFEEYLAAERAAIDAKHEYLDGEVFAMTGASYNHNLIVGNLIGELRLGLKSRPCTVLPSDMRVRIETANACKYPDLVALCEAPRFHDQRHDVLLNPTLIVEVLSPSTEAYDRGAELAVYRQLPTLLEYVLVSQDRPLVEVCTRQPDGRWLLDALQGIEAGITLTSVQCGIALREIYDKVDFTLGGG